MQEYFGRSFFVHQFDTGKYPTVGFKFVESCIVRTVFFFCIFISMYVYTEASMSDLPFKAYLFLLFVFIWLSFRSATGHRFTILLAVSASISPKIVIGNILHQPTPILWFRFSQKEKPFCRDKPGAFKLLFTKYFWFENSLKIFKKSTLTCYGYMEGLLIIFDSLS